MTRNKTCQCLHLHGHKAGEPLDYDDSLRVSDWAEWEEQDCTNPDVLAGDGCPYLDDFDVECPIKENELKDLEDWAIRKLAEDRKDRFTRVRELKHTEEFGGSQ